MSEADEIRRLRAALVWVHNSTEPDAIPHSNYGHLASNVYQVCCDALEGRFVDDMGALEVYERQRAQA